MQTLHEYFNLISGVIDLGIAVAIVITARRLTASTPLIVWILAAFFTVSGVSYLNEQSPVFPSYPTLAVVLDVARIAMLATVAWISPRLVRAVVESLREAKYEADDRRQAMLDRHYEM